MHATKTLAGGALLALALAGSVAPAFSQTAAPAAPHAPAPITKLEKIDTLVGTGTEATDGKVVTVHYTGWVYSYNPQKPDHKGAIFINTAAMNAPQTFQLGSLLKIKGLSQGVLGMKIGGKRTLIVPADLGYGAMGMGRGAVPRNAALVYEVELFDVKEPEAGNETPAGAGAAGGNK